MKITINMNPAIGELERAAETVENNAPINIAHGKLDQAQLERTNGQSFREAATVLRRYQEGALKEQPDD